MFVAMNIKKYIMIRATSQWNRFIGLGFSSLQEISFREMVVFRLLA